MRVKIKLGVVIFCVLIATAAQVWAKTILPDSCGDDAVKFEVKGEKNQPPPAPPAAGKAQIIFINTDRHYTARYGIDGAWTGANEDNSYFAVTVDPGQHHLCMSYQISLGGNERIREAATRVIAFTLEAGKVYYFEFTMGAVGGSAGATVPGTMTAGGGMTPAHHAGGSPGVPVFDFSQIDDDTGKYHVKAYKLSCWKTN